MIQLYRMAQDRRKWRATAVYFEPPLDDDGVDNDDDRN